MSKAPVRYAVAAISDCGNKRPSNEDAFGYSAEHGVYIVCDGMGGAAAGEIASSQAVNEVLRLLSDRAGKEDARLEDLVAEAIFAANQAIYSHAQQDANQIAQAAVLQQMIVQKQQQDALAAGFQDAASYQQQYNTSVAPLLSGFGTSLSQSH